MLCHAALTPLTQTHTNPTAFVNKMDRPAMNGFEIIEQLEKEFGLQSYPVTWPIGSGEYC
jgi:peptide subunit release factor RF-3